jgi:hypothetical protein
VETPVENDSPVRLIVTGSPNWDIPEAIARVMLNWWVENDRPRVTVAHAGRGNVDKIAAGALNTDQFPIDASRYMDVLSAIVGYAGRCERIVVLLFLRGEIDQVSETILAFAEKRGAEVHVLAYDNNRMIGAARHV